MTITQNDDSRVAIRIERRRSPKRDTEPDARPGFGMLASFVGAFGGLLTGACMVAATIWISPNQRAYELQNVALGDIENAAQSLLSARAATLVEEAKACRQPLGFLVVKATGKVGGTVRFRSGSYVTPYIRLGSQAERVAVPFPAPLAVGHGQILFDNNSDGADVFLVPGFRSSPGPSTSVISVRWNARPSC